jgi:hypothetical protein
MSLGFAGAVRMKGKGGNKKDSCCRKVFCGVMLILWNTKSMTEILFSIRKDDDDDDRAN